MSFMASTMLSFSPRQLFGNGEQGVWYDPADLSTMYQDVQGTTAVTGVEQAVGLILDKRNGRGLGAELVTNSTFATDTDWTKGTGWSIGSGVATKTAGTASLLSQAISLTAGFAYRLVYTITRSAGSITPQFTGGSTVAGTARSAAGTFVEILTAVSGNTTLEFSADASFAGTVDNVYVKRVSGNDAWQITSASRPVLSARYNLLTKTEQFDDAAGWTKDNVTITADATTAPNGTSTADAIYETTANNFHRLLSANSLGVLANVVYKTAIRIKYNGRKWVCLNLVSGYCWFDVETGAVGSNSATISGASISSVGNGFYLCEYKDTPASSFTATPGIYLSDQDRGSSYTTGYIGDVTKGVYFWGADLRFSTDNTKVPPYQRVNTSTDYDTAGFPCYLQFDGTDDLLSATFASLPSAPQKMSHFLAVSVTKAPSTGQAPFSFSSSSTRDSGIVFQENGGIQPFSPAATWSFAPATISYVQQAQSSGDVIKLNGVAKSVSSQTSNSTVYSSPIDLGRRNVSSLRMACRIYGLIVVAASSNTGQIADCEGWLNSRARAY